MTRQSIPTSVKAVLAATATLAIAVPVWVVRTGPQSAAARSDGSDWADYLGSATSAQYSPLEQVNAGNVAQMQIAWSYPLPGNGQTVGNPLVVDGRMIVPWSGGIVALDPATGRELWTVAAPGVVMRGLSSWADGQGKRRVFYHQRDRLYAIDAASGVSIAGFGDNGSIDLKQGLDRDPASVKRIEPKTPGRVFGNLIILGSAGGDEWNAPPGYIRAFDVRTGRLVWTFHSIPHPGEPGYDSWPKDAWRSIGGVNNWSEMTLDEDSGMLFVPLASAKYNFYGVNRTGSNLYANSLVALDARTGRLVWHFQTVHHDLWDYDLPQAPKLLTLNRGGRRVEAVAVAGKTGFIYTFERRTGTPVFPIEERAVPASDVPGEQASPTQPMPTAPEPFSPQRMTAADLSPYLSPDERVRVTGMLAGLRNEGIFTPPSARGTLQIPGSSGGTNWGNGAVDPRTGRFYVVSFNIPAILRLEPPGGKPKSMFTTGAEPAPKAPAADAASATGASVYAQNCAACHGETKAGQPPAIPALTDLAARRTIAQVQDTIARGRGPMPPFTLQPAALRALLRHLGFAQSQVDAAVPGTAGAAVPATPVRPGPIKLTSGYNFLFSKTMLPASATPWATLTAYDMNAGRKLWTVPFGELPMMKGSGTLFPRGTIVATGGGLILSGTQDRHLRAWDSKSGKLLFQAALPSIPGGVPAVYSVRGRQFVALPVASYDPSLAKMVSKAIMPEGRNSIVAFALPAKR
ncbi:PQQ-binding-like beta-propeller repeat protein [Sphingomonas sp. RP10(2022)]|uniref:PQQ-binding-like beta-propeller repeat protein n=1 Tax=Sphingomonas liriopis TaxID=2949094 RepID=A0A9X2HSI4_9SPHN|nr:PQQ-binding-like beta-propeller repeat protein [Sphingomonas liriopis]MCP3733521.1 PQQ-binding-like beta-propeller repeat protein [Sphingomonas liriopis]